MIITDSATIKDVANLGMFPTVIFHAGCSHTFDQANSIRHRRDPSRHGPTRTTFLAYENTLQVDQLETTLSRNLT